MRRFSLSSTVPLSPRRPILFSFFFPINRRSLSLIQVLGGRGLVIGGRICPLSGEIRAPTAGPGSRVLYAGCFFVRTAGTSPWLAGLVWGRPDWSAQSRSVSVLACCCYAREHRGGLECSAKAKAGYMSVLATTTPSGAVPLTGGVAMVLCSYPQLDHI